MIVPDKTTIKMLMTLIDKDCKLKRNNQKHKIIGFSIDEKGLKVIIKARNIKSKKPLSKIELIKKEQ